MGAGCTAPAEGDRVSLLQAARDRIPPGLKRRLRRLAPGWAAGRRLSAALPDLVCVDVGASYFAHTKWRVFLESPRTRWIAVEPNEANLGYLARWQWPCHVAACATGLSQHGGEQTLYVTNIDSGSSLLEPSIPPAMQHRIRDVSYYFPVTKKRISTITLSEAIGDARGPVFVKLDTQGTELSILLGASPLLRNHRIVGVELESTLLAQPTMKGSGRFWEACQAMEGLGYELLHIAPLSGLSSRGRRRGGQTYLNECDAVFAVRPDLAAELPVASRVALVAFYFANRFYEEALGWLERDAAVRDSLAAQGCDVTGLRKALGDLL